MADKQTQLVIAYFNSFDEANEAAKSLKSWDKANDDIKLGAIGTMYQTDSGKIKTKKYGQHNTGSGAKIGLLLGVLAALLPAVTLISGVVGGAIGGGLMGTFSRKGLGLSDEELGQIKNQVASGKAALAVLASPEEVDAVAGQLVALGGISETFNAPTEEITQVAQDVNAAEPDEIEEETAAPSEPYKAEAVAVMAAASESNEDEAVTAASESNEAEAVTAAPASAPRTLVVATVHYEGEEYVQLRNEGGESVNLAGWTVRDKLDEKSSMTFPEGIELKPGSTIKVFTAPGHNLTFNSKHPIWNNRGDVAVLLNPEGEEVSTFAYGNN
jgi:uncharacterized membrane protein